MDYRERWELKDYLFGRTLERRLALLQIGLGLLAIGFLLNFWYLQAVHGEEYAHLAENNRLRRIVMAPTRGVIFDRYDEVLAASRPSLDLIVLREGEPALEPQLRRLVPILDAPFEELAGRVEAMRDRPAFEALVLKEDVKLDELAQIEARRERFASVEVQQTARRSYPHGELFGHALGYVGEVSKAVLAEDSGDLHVGDIVGKAGLERAYDEGLRGVRGWDLVSVNNLGRRMAGPWVGREPVHGAALRLTLDLRLQRALREGLGDEAGAGVFLDPWTGEVLALLSTPSFDPNLFADGMSPTEWKRITEDPRRPLHDRAIASHYAPGSVFKVLMAVAGLETGTVGIDKTVYCGGSTTIYGQRRLCWKRGGHGTVNLHSALAHSCNIYFYELGKQLGVDAIGRYSEMFGMGHPTGIDVPGEVPGILPSREWKRQHLGDRWYPGDTISIAIGQGLLAVTPLQVATLVGAVATGGRIVRPHLTAGAEPEARQLELNPQTLQLVRQALREAVEQGTGTRAALEGISVAGKTGTAQVYQHSAGVDSDELPKAERDHAWFAGYAPADDPRIAFAVIVEHGGHGGATAAPVARAVLEVFFSERGERDVPTAPAG